MLALHIHKAWSLYFMLQGAPDDSGVGWDPIHSGTRWAAWRRAS